MRELKPDVVLMDYRMPGLNGAEATRAVLDAYPQTHVVCLSASVTKQEIDDVLAAGAVACVTKDEDFDLIVAAVCQAAAFASCVREINPRLRNVPASASALERRIRVRSRSKNAAAVTRAAPRLRTRPRGAGSPRCGRSARRAR